MTSAQWRTALILLAAALAAPVSAHTGSDAGSHHGFVDGFTHPFGGADHLLAILAVGFAAAAGTRRAWIAPAAFASAMLAGAMLAGAGIAVPVVEPMIAASVLVLGLIVAARARFPAVVLALPAGLFAVFHGAAHAAELQAASLGPIAGMLAATSVLLAAGMALGWASTTRNAWWARFAGAATSLAGAALLVSLVARS
ncbi:MAG TPA: HupE/UreJ family protein [Quisquiliibacterium sp.]|nr:HupE/UreJ family protein [Quisquiliibacterium sp.]